MEAWLVTVIVIFCIIFISVLIKLINVCTIGWNKSATCLVDKTVLVTGSNIGIGYYTALEFAKRGARVILACRNKSKAEAARAKIIEETGNTNVVIQIVDLSSLGSVRKFAKEIYETEDRLDILVNNAGIACNDHIYTADGLSLIMQSNHFGPFLLTILLLGLLKKSAPSRIVTVSSIIAVLGKININDLNAPAGHIFSRMMDYANTKLCNLLFTAELARKLEGTGVRANAVHPGAVQSDIVKEPTSIAAKLFKIVMALFYRRTEAGAQTPVYVAISKDLEGVTGSFFSDCKKYSMPRSARDVELCHRLWGKSEEFVNLTAEEKENLRN